MSFIRCILLTIFILFVSITGGFAQTTGKISGKVTDVEGNPLPGVNVVLEGELKGNASDVDGNYFILNVRPGTYTLVASMIGFKTVKVEEVQVSVDRTTKIDFQLQEETFQGEEVTIVANAKMITKDQTSASAKVSGDEILNLPVNNFTETVSVQAGVSKSENGSLHIRGGRSSEIKYYVDGVAVSNPFSNALATPVENSAIQEVEVISGTYNAEYGQANSGIINIVTRDGSDEFKGTFIGSVGSYATGNPNNFYEIDEASYVGEQSYEGSLSGPIVENKLTFFTNLKYTNNEGWLFGRRVFQPSDSSDFSSNNPSDWIIESTGDSSVVPMNSREGLTTMGKLTYRLTNNLKFTYSLTRSNSESNFYRHNYRLNPDYLPTQRSTSYNHLLTVNHVLNDRTFYNLRLTAYTTDFSQYNYQDPFSEKYRYIDGRNNQPANVFNTGGVDNYYLDRTSSTYAARFDITRQFGTEHLVKTGIELRYNELDFEEFFIQARRVDNLERTIPPISSRLHNQYNQSPIEAAAFIQDKIEISDLIVNVGLRFDYFDARGTVPTDLRDPSNSEGLPEDQAYRATEVKWQLSPRIGFAFPISDNGVIHASYGQFFQIPEYSRLYENPEFEVQSSNFTQFIGNAGLDAQRSNTYEIGLQQQIGDYVGIDVTAYYRDIRELVGTTLYEARTGGDTWGRYENTDFGRVRGITFSTDIRTDIGLMGSVNYTYQSVKGNASDPKQAFFNAQQNNETTRQLLPLSWDQRHNISGSLTYLQNNLTAGLLATFHTGYPFTPENVQRNDITVLRNQARYNAEFIVDLRIGYRVELYGVTGQLFFTAENLLNFYRQDREPKIFESEIEAHISNGNSRINSLRDYLTNPVLQPAPRLLKAGLQFNF
ncbi:TonB-dependent receptor [Gracilimonas tropica]|uniref:TonB-dependent receptor n=1 Tax=Gracilimonas tropica TaxID=454600 RepID=UPI00039C4630|nr:TonB-dependent receptor [Gracilimonas tropica]